MLCIYWHCSWPLNLLTCWRCMSSRSSTAWITLYDQRFSRQGEQKSKQSPLKHKLAVSRGFKSMTVSMIVSMIAWSQIPNRNLFGTWLQLKTCKDCNCIEASLYCWFLMFFDNSDDTLDAKDPRDARWQWDVDKTRQFLDEQALILLLFCSFCTLTSLFASRISSNSLASQKEIWQP